jgi:hypothetical protein
MQTPLPNVIPFRPSTATPDFTTADATRARDDEVLALKNGFASRPPLYALGTPVNELGVENFRQSRAEFEALPFANDVCDELVSQVEAEKRENVIAKATELHMMHDGWLRQDVTEWPITERALDGLARLVTPGGATYLRECPPDLRAQNLNHWLPRATREDRHGAHHPRELTLRTRITRDRPRDIFAIVGPRYSAFDIDELAAQVALVVPPDARADVVYDGYRVRINILFHSNITPERCVAGEFFKAGVLITTADDGTGAIKISAELYRNLCLNLIIIDRARQTVSTPHKGSNLHTTVGEGIRRALKKIEGFADKWSEASTENVLERYSLTDVDIVFKALVANRAVYVPGISPEDMLKRLKRAWEVEPGYEKTAFINAITRAAHTEEWRTWTTAEDLERAAGELLYARVWNVQLPEASV